MPGSNVDLVYAGTECGNAGGQCARGETLMFSAPVNLAVQPCGGLTFHWDFGDSATADGQNTAHAFAAGGTYRVTLIVNQGDDTQGVQSLSLTRDVMVNAELPPAPPLPFDFTIERTIALGAVSQNGYIFMASPTQPGVTETRVLWDFGDGTTAFGDWRVLHIYAEAVPHTVTLTVVGYSGQVQHTSIPPRRHTARH